jgi:hypothetical protein
MRFDEPVKETQNVDVEIIQGLPIREGHFSEDWNR